MPEQIQDVPKQFKVIACVMFLCSFLWEIHQKNLVGAITIAIMVLNTTLLKPCMARTLIAVILSIIFFWSLSLR